jgi:hypothetical protein
VPTRDISIQRVLLGRIICLCPATTDPGAIYGSGDGFSPFAGIPERAESPICSFSVSVRRRVSPVLPSPPSLPRPTPLMSDGGRINHVRLRASRACQACSRRKVRCDATEVGLPCSRCRADGNSNCFLVASRRGTYPRRRLVEAHRDGLYENTFSVSVDVSGKTAVSSQPPSSPAGPTTPHAQRETDEIPSGSTEESTTSSDVTVRRPDIRGPGAGSSTHPQYDSVTFMFERFLEQQGQNADDTTNACGVIFMSGASPLTFALEEAQNKHSTATLHDADLQLPSGNDRTGTVVCSDHPAHLSSHDVGYLKVKGALELPLPETLTAMVVAFKERFHPSYSIVDLDHFDESFKAGTLPWILLHSVCFIGSTFCDLSDVVRAGFKGRLHARRHFYDKAKLMFDIGYETNKVVLLQSVIMLSFWGPQMKSYWNPGSWVGFGVTIAESMGIHRIGASARVEKKRRRLFKRLFWVLAVRDAYCASLLGRPCRLNMSQCNTEPLTLDDFESDERCATPEGDDGVERHAHAHYQIQVARLSLILRSIVETRFGSGQHASTNLSGQLERWRSELPDSINWSRQHRSKAASVFSLSLKIIFHFQLILAHLEKPDEAAANASSLPFCGPSPLSCQITESAAYTISSTAFTMISNSMMGVVPHEVFPGFFVAGIVFFRGMKQAQDTLASSHLPGSALDNCRTVISEARDRWDPANWILRIFDFLLSSKESTVDVPSRNSQSPLSTASSSSVFRGSVGDAMPYFDDGSSSNTAPEDDILHSIDFGSPTLYHGLGPVGNEFFPMSNYLPIHPGGFSF